MASVETEIKKSILHVKLNRPEVRNAFDDAMIAKMTKTFSSINQNSDIRAVILTGRGESFCAGGDLNWMKSMKKYSEAENIADSERLYEMYETLTKVKVPVLSFVQGHVMGGGLGLIACSDIVLAEKDTQFCFSEVRLGLAPAVISSFVARKARPSDMARYFLTAEIFGTQAAKKMGLVHELGEHDEMKDLASKLAKKVANNSPMAVRATKRLVNALTETDDFKQFTVELIAKLRVSEQGQEGLSAFFEKRKPNWMESN